MKFNLKSAVKYSSALKKAIEAVESYFSVNSNLSSNYGLGENNSVINIPATRNGLYKATITRQKSKLKEFNLNLEDEIIEVEATGDFTKIPPEKRLTILNDLIQERVNIDTLIEKTKNNISIYDEFSQQHVSYDLGCQINNYYREFKDNILVNLTSLNSKLEQQSTENITVQGEENKKGSIVMSYPIIIEATSLVDSKNVLNLYEDINQKCILNSDKLSSAEVNTYFEYEQKFNLNPSLRSLIEQYS